MIIKKLTATFGTLSGETLELNKGLNIIKSPNESGKSTWCAFIKAMLYGIDSSERASAGHLPDKKKYLPWDGRAMEGAAEIELGGHELRLRRTGTERYPMRELTVTDVLTGEKLGGASGEALTGVPLRVFESTAFIGGAGLRVRQTPELEKMIAGLVSSGEETVSYSETLDTLKKWQRKRLSRQTGEIPRLEAHIEELEGELAELEQSASRVTSLAESVKRADMKRREARRLLEASEKRDAVNASQAAEKAMREEQAAYSALKSKRQTMPDGKTLETLDGLFDELSSFEARRRDADRQVGAAKDAGAEAREKLRRSPVFGADRDTAEKALSSSKASGKLMLVFLALLAVSIILLITVKSLAVTVPPLILSGALLAFFGFRKSRADRVLTELGVASPDEIRRAFDEADELKTRAKVSDERLREAEIGLTALNASIAETVRRITALSGCDDTDSARELSEQTKRLDRELSEKRRDADSAAKLYEAVRVDDFSAPETELSVEEARMRLKGAEGEYERLTCQLAAESSRAKLLGDPVVMQSELMTSRERLLNAKAENSAIAEAIDALTQANEIVTSRFSPALTKKAGAILSEMTGGRYDALSFDRSFNADARRGDDPFFRSGLYLSAGTVDQLYLALRLAIAELVLDSREPCPLILDDALLTFDDERMASALEMLWRLSEKRQIILFSCHSREKEWLKNRITHHPEN